MLQAYNTKEREDNRRRPANVYSRGCEIDRRDTKFISVYALSLSSTPLSSQINSFISSMSAGGAFGGNRGARPVPPEKGVFPLDHMHLCDLEKKEYISCLKTSGHKSEICRSFSKKYLECRMQKNLMAKQDMSELGFGKENNSNASEDGDTK